MLRVASNALWDIKFELLPRATNPSSTAPPTLSGLLAEAVRVEREMGILKDMCRSIENRMADIVSLLELEKERGRAKRPWWVLRWWWDRDLEGNIAVHRRQVERLRERLNEVVFLWSVVEHDGRPGAGGRHGNFLYAIASRFPTPRRGNES